MTLYITTTGTSVAAFGPPVNGEAVALRIARKRAALLGRHGADEAAFLIAMSAETNGLMRHGCGPGDEVLLLASDTDDGAACAEAVGGLIRDHLKAAAQVMRIAGLTPGAEQRFRQSGVRNLLTTARAAIVNARHDTCVINATGGFKSVAPYLTLLGMFHDVEVIYVFETSDALIRLPALPVRFDHDAVAFALPALLVLKERGPMTEDAFRDLLPPDRRYGDPLVDLLIEFADGLCDLSGAGELAVATFAPVAAKGRLFVRHAILGDPLYGSPDVQAKLRQLTDDNFRRLPYNRARRAVSTDCFICKPRSGAAHRIYYRLMQNEAGVEDVYVVDIVTHDEHQFEIQTRQRCIWWRDYEQERYDLVEFSDGFDPVSWQGELANWLDFRESAIAQAEAAAIAARDEAVQARTQATAAQRARDSAEARLRNVTARTARAACVAAAAFSGKTRKDAAGTPYVNHLVAVAGLLAEAGVTDGDVLCAGWLHDAIEDVGMTGERIEAEFGPRVRALVEEVSDDKSLPKEERKDRQVRDAPGKSADAQLLTLADKIANLRDLAVAPPADWPPERITQYAVWARRVIDALPVAQTPAHAALRAAFDAAEAALAQPDAP